MMIEITNLNLRKVYRLNLDRKVTYTIYFQSLQAKFASSHRVQGQK